MFYRNWSGLPADPSFPENLKELGYFINEDDEIRSLEDPENYFKFSIDKNNRINDRQLFAFNVAVCKVVHARLEEEGLAKHRLPLGATEDEPHLEIFASRDIATKKRVVVFFGEPQQELGILALRVATGPGGINKGSLVSVVKRLAGQRTSPADEAAPGIIVANLGQTYWWAQGKRSVGPSSLLGLPLPSMVHLGHAVDDRKKGDFVKDNETREHHVACVFEKVLPAFLAEDAKINILAVSEGARLVGTYLDDVEHLEPWEHRIGTLAILGGCYGTSLFKTDRFRNLMLERAMAFILSSQPKGTFMAGAAGNPNVYDFTDYGCPVFSSGEPFYDEQVLVGALDEILDWIQRASLDPSYVNPPKLVFPPVAVLPDDVGAAAMTDKEREQDSKAWEPQENNPALDAMVDMAKEYGRKEDEVQYFG